MVVVLLLVSSCVIPNSIDYVGIMESYLFLVYISPFQCSMIVSTLSHDPIITFPNWDPIGLISYWLINSRSSKTNCGIKAVVYNKCGDCFSLVVIAFSYSFNSFTCYAQCLPSCFPIPLFSFFELNPLIPLSFLVIYFSKSAQFPFMSRLLNATPAPTPIPAPSHSSTTVIAGVYLGLILSSSIIVSIDSFDWFFIIPLVSPPYPLVRSLFRAVCLSDIKSLIACSTISQISHMFLALLVFPFARLFHIPVHASFKSLLSLLAGSLIHLQSNFQSIYKIKRNNPFINILFILGSSVPIFPSSKEGMIHFSNSMSTPSFVFLIGCIAALFTLLHSLKIYTYRFNLGNNVPNRTPKIWCINKS